MISLTKLTKHQPDMPNPTSKKTDMVEINTKYIECCIWQCRRISVETDELLARLDVQLAALRELPVPGDKELYDLAESFEKHVSRILSSFGVMDEEMGALEDVVQDFRDECGDK